MNCKEFREEATFAATTSGTPTSGTTAHLKGCAGCNTWVTDARKRSDRWELFAQKLDRARSRPEGMIAQFRKWAGAQLKKRVGL